MKACRFGLILFAMASAAAPEAAADGYQVVQTVRLGGCLCKAEVLEDARLTKTMRNVLAGVGVMSAKDEALFGQFGKAPMKNAAIRIVGPKGKVMDHRTFDVPLADLREQPLALGIPKTPIYSLEIDHSRRDASFAGPAYHFFSVRGGKFDWVAFTDQGANKRSELVPTVSAANQFSLVPRADRKGKDFLLIRCDPQQSPPGPDGDKSATTYIRVHYEGGEWRATQDTKPGDQCRRPPSNGT